jgi:spermidine synthase
MNDTTSKVIYKVVTELNQYEVIDEIYTGRPARVLYSGKFKTAQSGIPQDNKPTLLFGYNRRFNELIENIKPSHVLAVGGGVYTLPSYIINNQSDISFDIVEPDAKLDAIAERYFHFRPNDRIKIFHDYGLHYLTKNSIKYDLTLIDAYSDNKIPDEILSKKFAKHLLKALKPDGLIAANVISDLAASSVLSQMHRVYKKYFIYVKVFPTSVNRMYFYPHNLIYVASNKPIELKMMYPEITDLSFL